MKKSIFILSLAFSMLFLAGCEKELTTEDISRLTEYTVITLEGDQNVYLTVGDTYTEQGATTSTGDEVKITGSVNTAQAGIYTIAYSATNVDGYDASSSRTVYVLPAGGTDVAGVEGSYTGVRGARGGGGPIAISKVAGTTGVYEVQDVFAGYYEYVAAYGPAYRGHGFFIHNSDDTWTFAIPASSPWGPLYLLNDLTYDGSAFSYQMEMDDGFTFGEDVFVLTKSSK